MADRAEPSLTATEQFNNPDLKYMGSGAQTTSKNLGLDILTQQTPIDRAPPNLDYDGSGK